MAELAPVLVLVHDAVAARQEVPTALACWPLAGPRQRRREGGGSDRPRQRGRGTRRRRDWRSSRLRRRWNPYGASPQWRCGVSEDEDDEGGGVLAGVCEGHTLRGVIHEELDGV